MSRYKSSDDMSFDLWEKLLEEGFCGTYMLVKKNHPDQVSPKRGRRSKVEPIANDIIRSHRAVSTDSDDAHLVIVGILYLAEKYNCSKELVYKASRIAKLRMGLGKSYRFSSLKGCFLHKTETERYKLKMMSKGRGDRGISDKRDKYNDVDDALPENPAHKVKVF